MSYFSNNSFHSGNTSTVFSFFTLSYFRVFSKNNGNLGESGCVSWMFEKKGIILINKKELNEDTFLNDLLEIGIDNFEDLDDEYQLLINPDNFEEVIQSLEKLDYNLEGDLSLIPTNTITISRNHLDQVSKLIEILEDHDDIQKVHTNLEISD